MTGIVPGPGSSPRSLQNDFTLTLLTMDRAEANEACLARLLLLSKQSKIVSRRLEIRVS
jgi:hypothetical protein